MTTNLASIPSPSRGVWHLAGIPIRAYAICIILGVIVAAVVADRRWRARGGKEGTIADAATAAVPLGLIGARLYHVITTPEPYWGKNGHPVDALKIWQGGLGIWGAVLFGALGAWLVCRYKKVSFWALADAAAPGIALAQAIGRWGNYFNQELFGKPTTLPWALKIDPSRPGTIPGKATYHPTFLYESLWCLVIAVVLLWADRRWKLGRGRVFALYVMLYTAGRAYFEYLRIDTAHKFLGLRLNDWTSFVLFAAALAFFLWRKGPREEVVEGDAAAKAAKGDAEGAAATDDAKADAKADAEKADKLAKPGKPAEETDKADTGDDKADKADTVDTEKAEAGTEEAEATEAEAGEEPATEPAAEPAAEADNVDAEKAEVESAADPVTRGGERVVGSEG
ncbi:MAG: prolipoprotein diacylglyceryl transferase [Mycobacteriales bacterium]